MASSVALPMSAVQAAANHNQQQDVAEKRRHISQQQDQAPMTHTIDPSHPRAWDTVLGILRRVYAARAKPLQVTVKGATVTIRPPKRTHPQNAYLWGVVYPCVVSIAPEVIPDVEKAHELCQYRYLRQVIVHPETGELLGETLRSTTTLNTAEFAEYVDMICDWLLSEYGVKVPEAVEAKNTTHEPA